MTMYLVDKMTFKVFKNMNGMSGSNLQKFTWEMEEMMTYTDNVTGIVFDSEFTPKLKGFWTREGLLSHFTRFVQNNLSYPISVISSVNAEYPDPEQEIIIEVRFNYRLQSLRVSHRPFVSEQEKPNLLSLIPGF